MSSLVRTSRRSRITRKQICVAFGFAVVTMFLQTGCEGTAFKAARTTNTVQAYARFLRRYALGAHRRQALDAIDDARFRQAVRGGGIYGYRLYLRHHGRRGRHAPEVRRRLAELALSRAKDVAALTLVIERYPGTPEARAAQKRLAFLEARLALRSSDPSSCEHFLRRYPGASDAKAVRERLAGMRFAHLGSRPTHLEAFLQRFAGTTWAEKASRRLRRRLRAEAESELT
ncbi:MAG: hypothetical protein KAI47_09615, partial [Deltaproteobacteria bacterium]|nr:hypothetical protein [Deltaproteobacteria bacterium]